MSQEEGSHVERGALPEDNGGENKESKKVGLIEQLYRLLRKSRSDGGLGEQLEELEKQIERMKKKREGVDGVDKLKAMVSQLKRRMEVEENELMVRGRGISMALTGDDEERKRWAIDELQRMVAEVGEEKVEEIMGQGWVEKLKGGEWDGFEIDKVEGGVEKLRKEDDKKRGERGRRLREANKELEEMELRDARWLVVRLEQEAGQKSHLTAEELEGVDASVREVLGLLAENEAGVVPLKRLMEELDSLPYLEGKERLRQMRAYLEVVEGRVDEAIMHKVLRDIEDEVGGVVVVELFGGKVEFYGGVEDRLGQLLGIMKEVDDLDSVDGVRVLRQLLDISDEVATGKWREISEDFKKYEGVRGVVAKQKLYLQAWQEKLSVKGREVIVPIDEKTGGRLPFDEEEWREMTDEERVAFKEFWDRLTEEEQEKMRQMRIMAKRMGDFNALDGDASRAMEAFMRRSGVDRSSDSYLKMMAEAESMTEEDRKKMALALMKKIMNTGETSRADANRELVWKLHSLLGSMEDAKLRNMIVVKLLWHDVQLSMPGVATGEDMARIAHWTWYDAYDDLLNMEIDLEVLELKDKKIGAREVIMTLESKPEGSSDIWLGRILGAKTPNGVELAQRQMMLAMSMERAGFSYKFDTDGRLVFVGVGAEEKLAELEKKFGLDDGGNRLLEQLSSGLRGEDDVFGEGEFGWMVGAAISVEHLTLRSVALEGGREWRLLPNALRKIHGYGQERYMRKVKPRFAVFANLFDLQFRSLPGWKFGNLLNVFEEKLGTEGMNKTDVKKFIEFLKDISLTDELSPELRRLEKIREMLDDDKFKEEMLKKFGDGFNWRAVLTAMGVEVGDGVISKERGWQLFRDNYAWVKVVDFTSMKHTDKPDFWKYGLASGEAFGSDIALGDGVTPGLITQMVKAITGKLGLGNEVGRGWGERAIGVYLNQSNQKVPFGLRFKERRFITSSGELGLEQWRWKDGDGVVMEKERERAEKMGYELGDDGFVYDEFGNRVFRQETPVVSRTEFSEWGLSGLDASYRLKLIKKWNQDGVLDWRARFWASASVHMSLWAGLRFEKIPRNFKEFVGQALMAIGGVDGGFHLIFSFVKVGAFVATLPLNVVRGLLDLTQRDSFDEAGAFVSPLWNQFTQTLSRGAGLA